MMNPLASLFLSEPHQSMYSAPQLDVKIKNLIDEIGSTQPGYHPVYRWHDNTHSKRQPLLQRDVDHVRRHFSGVHIKNKVRILDVGCNLGYASFSLAEDFNVVGLDIDSKNIDLCRFVAQKNGSNARFYVLDIFACIESGCVDFEQVDAVLLLNVIHQIIFAYGIERTKALLAKLIRSVDVIFAEMALKRDYVSHGKDHLLPFDPLDVFSECDDVDITKLEENPRPLFKISRRITNNLGLKLSSSFVKFSENPDPKTNRKYYINNKQFLKLHRFSKENDDVVAMNEIRALLKVRGTEGFPRIIDWNCCGVSAAVKSNICRGRLLIGELGRLKTENEKMKVIYQVVEAHYKIHSLIGYHNDLSLHNIIIDDANKLCVVDFEQASSLPLNDPFGWLLWTIYDVWVGDSVSYATAAYLRLKLEKGASRAPLSAYPDFGKCDLPSNLCRVVEDARQAENWDEFLVGASHALAAR